jgi:hypothetical protein
MNDSQWTRFKAAAKAAATTFSAEASKLEAICKRYEPEPGTEPEHRSDAWYALRIGIALRACRSLRSQGHLDHALYEALYAGTLAGDWPRARKWSRSLPQRLEQLAQGRETQKDARERSNHRLLAAVRAYRKKRPKDGMPTVARKLLESYGWRLDQDHGWIEEDGCFDASEPNGHRFQEKSSDEQAREVDALRRKLDRLLG